MIVQFFELPKSGVIAMTTERHGKKKSKTIFNKRKVAAMRKALES